MELKIKTETLQNMVAKSAKCVSNNKLIPLTSLLNLKVHSQVFTLTSTDATNYFYVVSEEKVDCEDFEVSILADIFIRLVQKTTSEYMTLTVSDNVFQVKGNGTYKIEIPLDENGGVIKFPQKLPDMEPSVTGEIKLSSVNFILNYNKPSLSTNMALPSVTCYRCGDKIISADSNKACITDINMTDQPLLVTPQMMELLGVMSDETINFHISDTEVIFWDRFETAYSTRTEGIETYPLEAIEGFVNGTFESSCKLSRVAVLDVLERISLFISSYDNKGIYLTFTQDGVIFSSKKSSGTELVPYVNSENFKDYTCKVDVELFKQQVSTYDTDNIQLSYGDEKALKLTGDKVVQVMSLMIMQEGETVNV